MLLDLLSVLPNLCCEIDERKDDSDGLNSGIPEIVERPILVENEMTHSFRDVPRSRFVAIGGRARA